MNKKKILCSKETLEKNGLASYTPIDWDLIWNNITVIPTTKRRWFWLVMDLAKQNGAYVIPDSFNDLYGFLENKFEGKQKTRLKSEFPRYKDDDLKYRNDALKEDINSNFCKNQGKKSKEFLEKSTENGVLLLKAKEIVESRERSNPFKGEVLRSISGNIDIDVLWSANNLLIDKSKKAEKGKAQKKAKKGRAPQNMDLSFIAMGTNWKSTDIDEKADKIREWMKIIVKAILDRTCVRIKYQPHGMAELDCVVSPHRIRKDKQWLVYGFSITEINGVPSKGLYIFKSSRITDVVAIAESKNEYIGEDFSINTGGKECISSAVYEQMASGQLTKDIVDLSAPRTVYFAAEKNESPDNESFQKNTAPATSTYLKLKEEPLHHTQAEIKYADLPVEAKSHFGMSESGWGYFKIDVCDAMQALPLFLAMGSHFKILYPDDLYNKMKEKSQRIASLYSEDNN